ncbi:LpxI family protein [Terrihabitans sp. B22-R8]|uniref:LpxI family protein n=1 Tax=Terrihabitans sp. B22-R8 TaxID=3425128 RepID=UPI00403CDA60
MPDGREAAAGPLAILCGGGSFPLAVAEEVSRQGRPVFLIGLAGIADSQIESFPHAWIRIGQFGRMIGLASTQGIREILFIGGLTRPANWRDLRPDWRLLMLLPRLLRALKGGDDRLLTALAEAVEKAGLVVRGVHEVAPRLLLPAGAVGKHAPSPQDCADARLGFEVLASLSPFDVGQGLVVARGRVIAVEAAEGTDLMLQRIADLRETRRLRLDGNAGVFVKAPKLGQDRRMDVPALGPVTVEKVHAAGLAGIAFAAGEVMAVDAASMIETADRTSLFVAGFDAGKP